MAVLSELSKAVDQGAISRQEQLIEHPDLPSALRAIEVQYGAYVETLSSAIAAVEKIGELEKEKEVLQKPELESSLRASAQTLADLRGVDIKTHIYSVSVMHSALGALNNWKEAGEEDPELQAEIQLLLAKVLSVSEKIFRNGASEINKFAGFGNPVKIELLNSLPILPGTVVQPFTEREWELVIQAVERISSNQRANLRQRDEKVRANGEEARGHRERIPASLSQIDRQGALLSEMVLEFNNLLLREYTVLHPGYFDEDGNIIDLKHFIEWKESIICETTKQIPRFGGNPLVRSLENRLGHASGNNHFDIFKTEGGRLVSSYGHIHETLSIQIFLALGNSSFDMAMFQGEGKSFDASGRERGFDFKIPKDTGVVQAGILERVRAEMSR